MGSYEALKINKQEPYELTSVTKQNVEETR